MGHLPFLANDFEIQWSQLTADQVGPSLEAALASAGQAIDAIATQPLEAVSYESTFLALERSTEDLNRAWEKVTHLQSVADSPELRDAHNRMLPKVTAFYAGIPLNPELWRRLKTFAESSAAREVTGIQRRLLDETVADFVEAGANLPIEKRQRLEAIQSELAQLTQSYSEHVLDATNAWEIVIEDESRLKGIPDHAKATARRSAESKQQGTPEKPAWRFTLQYPSQEPVMVYAEDEALRREVWKAATTMATEPPHDNRPLVPRILALRDEEAKLLGRAHFADQVLQRRMAKTGERALNFIEDLRQRAEAAFRQECTELEEFKAAHTGEPVGPLKAWELSYWAEKLRRQRYDFDEEVIRPYFPMNRVIDGLFALVGRVFGLKISERVEGSVETWHPEVKFYDLWDDQGRHLGSFYSDWYPRESKRGGAWMGSLITGGPEPDGRRAPHLGYICGNVTPPQQGKPALLTHREVETVFHEFGHLLHHLLGEVEIKSLNGVNVAWDFVELPSQIMENWCWERESLDLFARHHETGEPIPEDIFAKMIAARNFRAACATTRQVQFAKMDLLMHVNTVEFVEAGDDLEQTITAAVANTIIPSEPPARPIVYRFGHLFSDPVGYAAGYYSYKWAEVLDADAFTRFKKEGIFNASVGREFVRHILSRGNSEDPEALFRAFMGRDPDLTALLVRSGLQSAD